MKPLFECPAFEFFCILKIFLPVPKCPQYSLGQYSVEQYSVDNIIYNLHFFEHIREFFCTLHKILWPPDFFGTPDFFSISSKNVEFSKIFLVPQIFFQKIWNFLRFFLVHPIFFEFCFQKIWNFLRFFFVTPRFFFFLIFFKKCRIFSDFFWHPQIFFSNCFSKNQEFSQIILVPPSFFFSIFFQ